MTLKIVHTKDGRTLYKDLDTGHWVNKKNVPSDILSKTNKPLETPQKQSSDIRDVEKDEQIKKREAEAKRLNQPKPETIENKYGFEVENKDDPVLSFTDSHWKRMAELKKQGKFYNHDLYDEVKDKITEIVDKYGDLYEYNSDACILRERMDEYGITDHEWWAGWHLLAEWLGLKGKKK